MNPERWQRVKKIVDQALETPPGLRGQFLDRACDSDPDLRVEAESLLAADQDAGDFLTPATETSEQTPPSSPGARQQRKFSSGEEMGNYRIIEELGSGGMGVVYRAQDLKLDRQVALKVLSDSWGDDAEQVSRFEREARMLASLNHPNIAQIYAIDSVRDTKFLVLELIEGEDLASQLERGTLSPDEATAIALQVVEGLCAAHELGLIHRDLKPANIRINLQKVVKILDFGLAKPLRGKSDSSVALVAHQHHASTAAGILLGTPTYMSPEQIRGLSVDRRVDIWAFGCVLYQCLTGFAPFERETIPETFAAVLNHEPDLKAIPATVPGHIVRLLMRCLDKNPRTRLQDIGEARVILEKGVEEAPPKPAETREVSFRQWAMGSVALITALVAAFYLGSTRTPPALENPLLNATISKLTDFDGTEMGAAISRDGKYVAFVSDQDGPLDAWVTRIDTGYFWNVTRGQRESWWWKIRDLGFDLDGANLWLAGGDVPIPFRIISLRREGEKVREYLDPMVVNVDWSPNEGNQMVYHTSGPGDPMFVANADGSQPRWIHGEEVSGIHQHYPTWSFNGDWIYFTRGRPATLEMNLWRVRPDGTEPEQLTWGERDAAYPAPLDENTILFVALERDGGGPFLWSFDARISTVQRVSFGVERFDSICASEDGRRVVAAVSNPRSRILSVPIGDGVATEADVVIPKGFDKLHARAPRYGKDALYFLSSYGSSNSLARYSDVDGTLHEILGRDHGLREPAAVAPDGRSAVVIVRSDGQSRLTVVGDGPPRSLDGSVKVTGSACWSPDGKWVAVGGVEAGESGLYRFPVDGGVPEKLLEGDALDPVWSPRGDVIVYSGAQEKGLRPILAINVKDRSPVDIPGIFVLRIGERVRFLPDGSGIIYMKGWRPSQDFWRYDFATRKKRQLTRFEHSAAMRTFDVHPDGKSIIFDRTDWNSDIVLFEFDR